MCEINADPCEVWNETIVKRARKEHRCDCCFGTIPIGASYKRIFMVSDGYPYDETECAGCSLMMVLFKAAHRQWMTPSSMREVLQECYSEDSYLNEEDERVASSVEGRWWKAALDEMDARAKARCDAASNVGPSS